jgi:hypothetical protein
MIFYGLDDSQRPLNGNCRVLTEFGLKRTVITVHYLFLDDNSGEYIWTLGTPEASHGENIAKFLLPYLTRGIVVACRHYYETYPVLTGLHPWLYFTTNRSARRLFYYLDGEKFNLKSSTSYDPCICAYKGAHSASRKTSRQIYDAFIQGDFEKIKVYMEHYFGEWPF